MKMKLKPEARQEYDELKKVMDYVNLHPLVVGRFTNIKYGNLNPENHEHPIFICEGDASLNVKSLKYPLELARNYLGPRWNVSDKGIYLRVSDILHIPNNFQQLYGGILSKLVFDQSDYKLISEEIPFGLGYQPIDSSKTSEIDKFFSQAESIIGLVNSPEIRKNVRDLEKILSLAKQD
jgi:hypothetical protein